MYLAGLGLDELRLVREIDAAAGHVHGQPRDAQLLLTLGVEVADLGDGEHLPEQTQVVDPPLVHGGRRQAQLGLGRPADLPLDLLDEVLDAGGHAERLLALERDEGRPVLLIREVDLDGAGGQEGTAHQAGEDDHVLPEEATAGCHASVRVLPFTPTISSGAAGPTFPGSGRSRRGRRGRRPRPGWPGPRYPRPRPRTPGG